MKNRKIIMTLLGFISTFSIVSCSANINSYILNFTHFTGKKFSLFLKSSQFYSPYEVFFNITDDSTIIDIFKNNNIDFKEVNLANEQFYMFSFTQDDLSYNFELKTMTDETYEYYITSNLIDVEVESIQDTILASFPYYLVNSYYRNLKVIDGKNVLFETSNSYNSFKEFYLNCAENIYTFNDNENTIVIDNKYSIKIENDKGYFEKVSN